MKPPTGQHEILPVHLPALLAVLLGLASVAAWYALHVLRRRTASRAVKGLLFAASVAVGFVALLTGLDVAQRELTLATNWPMWPLALGGAALVEILLSLYALEKRIVSPRVGATLAALRIALALLVIGMLAQPVRSTESSRSLRRYVAVLVDISASMQVPDDQMTRAEKVRLAELIAPDAPPRPYHLEPVATRLRRVREKLAGHIDWAASLREASPEARLKQLQGRYDTAAEALEELKETVDAQHEVLAKPFQSGALKPDSRVLIVINNVGKLLRQGIGQRITDAIALLGRGNLPKLATDPQPLLDLLRGASAAITGLEPKLHDVGDALDEAFYASLPTAQREAVDVIAAKTRAAIVRDLLGGKLRRPGTTEAGPSLLEQLADEYGVRLYTFATEAVEVDLERGLDAEALPANGQGQKPREDQQRTDLARALEKVITEMPAERLAGILLLTDGRHNATRTVEPLARRIGLLQVPICSIVFGGGARPATDAAVVALDAPDTIYAKDKVYLNADLKLDGMAGKTVRVTLYDGDDPVTTEEIEVQADSLRTRVQLADEPGETGDHHYRVKVEDVAGEVLSTNNELPLSVRVTDDQTRFLIIEGRPRWEFRYLKNLFASRDRTVKIQYVLLHPDTIPGQPPRPKVHASAARAKQECEATAPPENEAEWMKFDVIFLGDVGPSVLRDDDLAAIKKFVTERAGTLIVIAGPRHMPHAYPDTPLADMLPVSFHGLDGGETHLAPAEKTFHIALTAEGRDHVITRLQVDPQENLATWNSFPELFWRHPMPRAKEGATVLAYALPPTPPEFLTPTRAHEIPDEDTIRQRRQFVRDNALVSLQKVALGQVLFLSFDRTWRLRYRVGDTHHHKFWGQVLRWATADKLPAGTTYVKVGSDRPRYPADANVRVRAKITQTDYTPVVSDDVHARIFDGDQLVLKKKMTYVANSLGMFRADLGQLAPGKYRFELDAPEAKQILAGENADKAETKFSVIKTIPDEEIELSADRGLLEKLANLTGGLVAVPPRALDTVAAFGPGTLRRSEPRQWSLWDSWPLLILVVLIAGAEWLLRKRARLP